MRTLILALFAMMISGGVWGQDFKKLATTNFISLTVPIAYNGSISYLNEQDIIENKNINDVKHDSSLLASFPNLVSSVTIYQVEENGGLTLLGNGLSKNKKSYIIIYDFAQTQTLEISEDKDEIYYALIGISVRMVARVDAKKSGVDLPDLYGLGLAVSKGQLSGSLEVRVNGVNSLHINSLIPVTSDLSPSSISNALQAVATIKSHIYDSKTKISPQFLAFNTVGGDNEKDNGNQINFDFQQLNTKMKNLKK